jgi:flagellin-like protein
MLRDRRALSPVFSTVIMILVVTIGMSIVFAYFVGFSRDFQLGPGSAVAELIEVEDVWFHYNQTTARWEITITLYSYGKVDSVNVNTLYINDEQVQDFNVQLIKSNSPLSQHGKVTVDDPDQYTHGLWYNFRLVTQRGSVFETAYLKP